MESLPEIAKWQGSKRQANSFALFGKPPTLSYLPRDEWKSCSDYTDDEIAELDEYAEYWEKRMAGDKDLVCISRQSILAVLLTLQWFIRLLSRFHCRSNMKIENDQREGIKEKRT